MTTTVKAKCPGCGDEDKEQPEYINSNEWSSEEYKFRLICSECDVVSTVGDWLHGPTLKRLHPDDIAAIASRVVELMKS